MRINIPIKLQKYKDHIKKSSFQIVYNKNFSFLKIASNFKDNTYKELYLCYNPYNTNIVFDINNFKNDKEIYKLYPQIVNVPNNEVFAFMVFSTAKSELDFNSDTLIYNKKNKIKELLKEINQKNKVIDPSIIIEEYKEDINSTMMLDNVDAKTILEVDKYNINKTQYLGDYLNIGDLQEQTTGYKHYVPESGNVKVKLKDISYSKKKYLFTITLINNSISENYFISKIKVNLFDKVSKETVEIKKEINLKKYSQKDMDFSIEENVLKDFSLNDVKVDVVLE